MSYRNNILGNIMMPNNNNNNKENYNDSSSRIMQPKSGQNATGKQHKLKQRFTVIRKLGKGTYGKVQLAINKQTGQEVAIKTIKKTKIENEQDLQRVRREIQIMSSIEHPHIIHIYEVFENKDKIVLIMQYAPGGELYEYVSQSKLLDDSEARRLFRQIATAIYYCHQNKICHRDLKLENILLDEKNNAKLADFGLSNVFDKSHQLSTFCGSPLYASPEIVQGSPYEGPEVDCWSLGVLLYTLVYGAMPFDGSNFKRLVKQISESSYFEPQQRSLASPLIRRLLCADPTQRATILDICSDPWVNGQQQQPQQQQSPTSPEAAATSGGNHQSLLKVAQDMASLTPVRLDILLALAPGAAATGEAMSEDQAPRAPLARAASGGNLNPNSRHVVMDVDQETRATSPVASYIVRDLTSADDMDQPKELPVEAMDNAQDDTAVQATEQQAVAEPEVSGEVELAEVDDGQQQPEVEVITDQVAEDKVSEEHSMEEVEQVELAKEQPIEEDERQGELCEEDIRPEPMDKKQESAIDEEIKMEVEIGPAEVAQQQEAVQIEVDGAKVASPEAEESPDDKGSKGEETGLVEGEKNEQKQEGEQLPPAQKSEGEPEAAAGEPNEEKPKTKTKKKIVVVKKRKKKVSKKDADGEETTGDKVVTGDKSTEPANEDVQQEKTAATAKPKQKAGPGKVRIPNTFQPPAAAPEAAPKVDTGRRQSALVLDVSQKLMQSGATSPNEQKELKSDQPQLASVRVSDKKSEFERRASMASLTSSPVKVTSKPAADVAAQNRCPAELLHEPAEWPGEQLTIVEPVERLEAQEVACAHRLSVDTSGQMSEDSQTPTQQRVTSATEVRRQLEECASKLDQGTSSLSAQVTRTESRSDSVETIKADGSSPLELDEAPTKRASLRIELGRSQPEVDGESNRKQRLSISSEASSGQRAAISGPAPITRSYKKVTFTRDGACITETGKIYSTKADDGTVRRVERKSKVTHYPATGSGSAATGGQRTGAEMSHEEEEVVYEEAGDEGPGAESVWRQKNSSSQRSGRPFERLIMPAPMMDPEDQFMSQATDNFTAGSTGGFSGRRSRQLGRADSSCSSCSSGSTDIFDDIFDHWTGAISMFNQAAGGGFRSPHRKPLMHQFGHRLRGNHHQSSGGGGSLFGTPRCESAEPGAQSESLHSGNGGSKRRHKQRHQWRSPGSSCGYESDAGTNERPATALGSFGGSRKRNSFSRLFPAPRPLDLLADDIDPFGRDFGPAAEDISRSIEREHENLRRRIAQQHKQLWKGSTPSLFGASSAFDQPPVDGGDWQQPPHRSDSQRASGKATSGWQRPPRPNSSASSSGLGGANQQKQPPQQQQVPSGSWPRESLEQSQSSSSFLLQKSTALQSAPNRRPANTSASGQLPPRQEPRRSTSRSSLISGSNQQQSVERSLDGEQQVSRRQHQTASFIELKRTSSSTSGLNQQQQFEQKSSFIRQQQQQSGFDSAIGSSSRLISTSESSSAAFREQAVTPTTPASTSAGPGSRLPQSQEARENLDSRVQSWLQESSGNLSTNSSGTSKSSVSDLQHSSGSRLIPQATGSGQQAAVKQSASSSSSSLSRMVLVSQSSSSMRAQEQQQAAGSRSITSKASFTLRKPRSPLEQLTITNEAEEEENGAEEVAKTVSHRTVTTSSSSSTKRLTSAKVISSTCSASGGADPFNWGLGSARNSSLLNALDELSTSNQEEKLANSSMFQLNGNGNQSGADLESHSSQSSSLLDQLRSRGYRSMIEQRMVSPLAASGQAAEILTSQQQQQSSSSSQVITSESSGCSSKQVVKQQQMIVTSSSSTTSQSRSTRLGAGSTFGPDDKDQDQEVDILRERFISLNRSEQVSGSANNLDSLGIVIDEINNKQPGDKIDLKPLEEIEFLIASNESSKPHDTQELAPAANKAPKSGQEEANQVNGQVNGQQEEEEEEDEDIKVAKASIKAQLNQVRETELFLKSLQAEEAEAERQRQQMLMFSNLMLLGPPKLSPGHSPLASADHPFNGSKLSPRLSQLDPMDLFGPSSERRPSATNFTSSLMDDSVTNNEYPDSNLAPSSGFSFGFASRKLQRQPLSSLNTGGLDWWPSTAIQSRYSTTTSSLMDPLATTNGHYSPPLASGQFSGLTKTSPVVYSEFRRCKSQLGDQFPENGPSLAFGRSPGFASRSRATSRPLSANFDSLNYGSYGTNSRSALVSSGGHPMSKNEQLVERNPYFPSSAARAKRSVSQLRNQSWQTAASEVDSVAPVKLRAEEQDSDGQDSDGMGAYRAAAYVPKVVPQGLPARGRSHSRRGTGSEDSGVQVQKSRLGATTSDWALDGISGAELNLARRSTLKSRLSSDDFRSKDLKDKKDEEEKADEVSRRYRRRSLTAGLASERPTLAAGSGSQSGSISRLQELEQRIQANKRRRDELLAGGSGPQPQPSSSLPSTDGRGAQEAESSGSGTQTNETLTPPLSSSLKLTGRPSRLESMEARIKRRSYCVRMGEFSPERSQSRADKYRRPSRVSLQDNNISNNNNNDNDY